MGRGREGSRQRSAHPLCGRPEEDSLPRRLRTGRHPARCHLQAHPGQIHGAGLQGGQRGPGNGNGLQGHLPDAGERHEPQQAGRRQRGRNGRAGCARRHGHRLHLDYQERPAKGAHLQEVRNQGIPAPHLKRLLQNGRRPQAQARDLRLLALQRRGHPRHRPGRRR